MVRKVERRVSRAEEEVGVKVGRPPVLGEHFLAEVLGYGVEGVFLPCFRRAGEVVKVRVEGYCWRRWRQRRQ